MNGIHERGATILVAAVDIRSGCNEQAEGGFGIGGEGTPVTGGHERILPNMIIYNPCFTMTKEQLEAKIPEWPAN